MEDPQEDPWQCTASVYSGSVLLGDLLGVSRSREGDLLSVLFIYPRNFLRVFVVYRPLVGFFLCDCILLYVDVC